MIINTNANNKLNSFHFLTSNVLSLYAFSKICQGFSEL